MTVPIWTIALIVSFACLVPSFLTRARGDYDFGPAMVGCFCGIGFLATWLCYIAYMMGVWFS